MVRLTNDRGAMQGCGDHFVRPYGPQWLVIERDTRIVGQYEDKGQAVQVAAYLNGEIPDDDAAGWDWLIADVEGAA